jgi:hypothetical protein
MRRAIAPVLALTLLAAACGSDNDSSVEDTSTTTPAPTTAETSTSTTTTVAVTTTTTAAVTTTSDGSGGEPGDSGSALVIVAVSFDTGFILIRNDGDADYDLSGHWLCNRPTYTQLPDLVLAPGDVIEIDASKVGLDADSGELGLYTSGDFGNPAAIIRYVQWGTDSHGRTGTAVAGGVWQDGDFVDNQGGNLESSGSDPVSVADWSSN